MHLMPSHHITSHTMHPIPFLKDFNWKSNLSGSPAIPGQPRGWLSKSILFKGIRMKNQSFLDPRPSLASPGSQNRCFWNGFKLKIKAFWIPGRPWPALVLKIDAFLKDFNYKLKLFRSPAVPGQPRFSKWMLFERILIKNQSFLDPAVPGQPRLSKSILFKTIFIKIQSFLDPRPSLASPGSQNQYFSKRFSLKFKAFWILGRPWPAPALKINAFQNDFH